MTRDELLELLGEDSEAVVLEPEGLDAAILGYDRDSDRLVYSFRRIVDHFVGEGMTEEEI